MGANGVGGGGQLNEDLKNSFANGNSGNNNAHGNTGDNDDLNSLFTVQINRSPR